MSGRTAIVTGGASGIGGAISRRLATDGNLVAILDINRAAAESAADEIVQAGGKAIGLGVDVTDRAQIESGIEAVRAELGRPTILVNCAGATLACGFLDITRDAWQAALAVNLTSAFDCCQVVIPDMVAEGWGRIVNISSSSVHSGSAGLGAYVTSKSGVVGLTKVLALEFGKHGITVNSIPPGFIDTPMLRKTVDAGMVDVDTQIGRTPVGRIGQPEDVAATTAFLVGDEAGYITGQLIGVNGGRNT
ncbi:SDR family NAD(P)-dependent oxidoreductase [Gordonia sp. CPCC 206044]|uniref:SDR family NAD(P)-dependent oxidoreductase n=1 Tax=Gordonia sp. CPCC 206044 TaxID=3140793 RepID=UPI003AF3F8FD